MKWSSAFLLFMGTVPFIGATETGILGFTDRECQKFTRAVNFDFIVAQIHGKVIDLSFRSDITFDAREITERDIFIHNHGVTECICEFPCYIGQCRRCYKYTADCFGRMR